MIAFFPVYIQMYSVHILRLGTLHWEERGLVNCLGESDSLLWFYRSPAVSIFLIDCLHTKTLKIYLLVLKVTFRMVHRKKDIWLWWDWDKYFCLVKTDAGNIGFNDAETGQGGRTDWQMCRQTCPNHTSQQVSLTPLFLCHVWLNPWLPSVSLWPQQEVTWHDKVTNLWREQVWADGCVEKTSCFDSLSIHPDLLHIQTSHLAVHHSSLPLVMTASRMTEVDQH